jgi:hypothetical protein
MSAWLFSPLGPLGIIFAEPEPNEWINRPATRSKTFHRGINQRINLGDIKSGIGGINSRSVSTTSTVSTPSLSISMVVLILLTLAFLTGMASIPCGSREAYHSQRDR